MRVKLGNFGVTWTLTCLYITLNSTKSNDKWLILLMLSFSTQLLRPESVSLNFMLPSCSPHHSFRWFKVARASAHALIYLPSDQSERPRSFTRCHNILLGFLGQDGGETKSISHFLPSVISHSKWRARASARMPTRLPSVQNTEVIYLIGIKFWC